jgi:hypothetical protein
VFASPWTWLVPLLLALGVFVGVLWTTPPGFGAISAVLFGTPRGADADAAAYALASAASLALGVLVLAAGMIGIVESVRRRAG